MSEFDDIDEMSAWIDQPEADADADRWGYRSPDDADQARATAWRRDIKASRLRSEQAAAARGEVGRWVPRPGETVAELRRRYG